MTLELASMCCVASVRGTDFAQCKSGFWKQQPGFAVFHAAQEEATGVRRAEWGAGATATCVCVCDSGGACSVGETCNVCGCLAARGFVDERQCRLVVRT